MNKLKTIALGTLLTAALGVTAFAANEQTQVVYNGSATEQWSLTVPARLTPNELGQTGAQNSGDVKVKGTWASNKSLKVTTDSTVTLTSDIDSNDTVDIDVNFPGITLSGDNDTEVSETQQIEVGDVDHAMFGTWAGTITYDVSFINN